MQKLTPCLWFDRNAEEAVAFYTSVFKDSKIDAVTRYQKGGMGPAGSVMTIAFRLAGQKFLALNGGPIYKFTPALSLIVNCRSQKKVDAYWEKLSKGGKVVQCGWLTDKYGLSWQIVPIELQEMLLDKDARKTRRVMDALLKMKKLDLKALQQAYKGKA